MADSEVFYPSRYAGRHTNHGSLPVKAATKYPKGTMVVRDANGRAARPAAGLHVHGVSEGDFDNTSAGPQGNLGNDAFNVELAYGVHEFAYTGTAPKAGQKVYCVDNVTVSLDSSSGTRGVAGIATEQGASSKVCVFIDPVMNGALAAGTASAVLALSLALGHADLTDADGSQSFDIGTLPENAVLLGASITITEAFDDGAAGTFVADIGISGGDTDAILDGAADNLGATGVVAAPLGVRPLGRYAGEPTLAVVVNSNVNVVTATTGAALVEVFYAVV
jgi:hypothetical protein